MKQFIIVCAFVALSAGFAFGQDLAKNNDTPKPKPPVTTAALTPEEIKEGKDILADAQKFALTREGAQKVFTETVKNTPEARLLAYDSWWAAVQGLEGLQIKMNKLIARAQERSGCNACSIDLEKGTLSAAPAK